MQAERARGYCRGMDTEWVGGAESGSQHAGTIAQLALTAVVALGGVWAAVSFADRDTSNEPGRVDLPAVQAPRAPDFAWVVQAESAAFFIVGSEEAHAEWSKHLASEAAVRGAAGQPARVAWIAVAHTDEDAAAITDAVNRDAGTNATSPAAMVVIDLRR